MHRWEDIKNRDFTPEQLEQMRLKIEQELKNMVTQESTSDKKSTQNTKSIQESKNDH